MTFQPPVGASGSRVPSKPQAAKVVPKIVRDCVDLMIFGIEGNDEPINFIEAAKVLGKRPEWLRRWLLDPRVIQYMRSRRKLFLETLCAANPGALAKVRDKSANPMASVRASMGLEQMNDDGARGPSGTGQQPGFVIIGPTQIWTPPQAGGQGDGWQDRPAPRDVTAPITIDAQPNDAGADEAGYDPPLDPRR
jgi:hypothetical protein